MFQGLKGSGLIRKLDWSEMGLKGGSAEKYQVCPCFGTWILLGLVQFVVLGDVSWSGGIWVEAEACLVRNGVEGGVG